MIVDESEKWTIRRSIEMLLPDSISIANTEGATGCIYIGLSDGSQPSRASEQYVQVAISSNSIVGVYFHPESTICINISVVHPVRTTSHLLA